MENKNIYVGHRYVPKIIGVHDSTQAYEGLSIVTHEGTSYTSKKYVPEGVSITNDEFWVVTGNYNVQVEHYRNEVNQIKKSQDNIISEISDVKTNHDDLKNDYEQTKEKILNNTKSIFNIYDYGIEIDGVKDNTQTFKNVITDIKNNGGGILEIPYTDKPIIISESLDMPSNIVINGNGNTIKSKSSSNETTPLYFHSKQNIYINNLNIDGMKDLKDNQQSVSGGSNGITFTHECKNIIVENCYIYNTLEHGIHFISRPNDLGTKMERCENIIVSNCFFENNGNVMWSNGNRGAGIMCFNGVRNIKIINNTFKDFVSIGAYIDSAYNTKERLEELYPNIKVHRDEYMGDNVHVHGNTFIMTKDYWVNNPTQQGAGIALHGQKNVIVSSNLIKLDIGRYRGISISNGQEDSNTRNISIFNNDIVSTHLGIQIISANNVMIANNKIHSITEHGIHGTMYVRSLRNINIFNNYITTDVDNKHGVFIDNNSDILTIFNVVVSGNKIRLVSTGNVNSGVYVLGKCNRYEVQNNSVENGKYGLRSSDNVAMTLFLYNTVTNCDNGIYATSTGVVEFNTILNCERPLGLNVITPQYNVTE